MSWASVGGIRATRGALHIPYEGMIVADVELATDDALPTKTSFVLGDMTIACAVTNSVSFGGVRSARLVGGTDGWSKTLPSAAYNNPGGVSLAIVLSDAAAAVGETISQAANTIALGVVLGPAPIREAGPPSRTVLRQWCDPLWWIDASGQLQLSDRQSMPFSGVVTDTAHLGAIASVFSVEKLSAGKRVYRIATESPSDWTPGRTFSSAFVDSPQIISAVTHRFDDDGWHRVQVLVGPATTNRGYTPFAALVRAEDPRRSFDRISEFSVQAVSPDGTTADITPTDTTIGLPGIVRVALRLPFLTGTIAVGQKVLVFFVNGDPARPAILASDPVPTKSALDATSSVTVGASAGLVQLGGGSRVPICYGDVVQPPTDVPWTSNGNPVITGGIGHVTIASPVQDPVANARTVRE